MKEIKLKNVMKEWEPIDTIADFNSKTFTKEVNTPYPIYNSYLEAGLKVLDNPDVDEVDKRSFIACAGSVYSSNCIFRLRSSLQAYCDFIGLITRDQISNVSLYESLVGKINMAINLLDSGHLFRYGSIDKVNVYNFAFTFSSLIFDETVDILYRYGITITEKLYSDLTMANVIYSEVFREDLLTLLEDYNNYYKPYLTYGENELPF